MPEPTPEYPDVAAALQGTWRAARHEKMSAEQSFAAAKERLHAAQDKVQQVRRQIEGACPPLGLDPIAVMADDPLGPEQQPYRPTPAGAIEPRAHYEERVSDLVADGRLVRGEKLRTVHHGTEHLAHVEADGSISGTFGSQPTLTAAARAIVGGERNGWKFWTVQRDRDWIPVADLRRN